MQARAAAVAMAALAVAILGACADPGRPDGASPTEAKEDTGRAPEPLPAPDPGTAPETPEWLGTAPGTSGARARPAWLGTRVLPLAPDGFGVRLATPAELVDRRLVTSPLPAPTPPPPPEDGSFRATSAAVPEAVVARSTWTDRCPVTLDDLRYLTVTFIGFDDRAHTGELIVHREVAEDVISVFAALHTARFPLEEVRVIAAAELDLQPTGDGNVTSAFVCRPTVGGTRWSEHAYGRAIDVNPFHNPYVRGDLVLPELASAYLDRDERRPGMIVAGDAVTAAFAAVGWGWGGDWTGSATDPMHFSTSGR